MEGIKNFEQLCNLLTKFKNASEEDSVWLINEMQELDGYFEWLEWMEKNRPEDLP